MDSMDINSHRTVWHPAAIEPCRTTGKNVAEVKEDIKSTFRRVIEMVKSREANLLSRVDIEENYALNSVARDERLLNQERYQNAPVYLNTPMFTFHSDMCALNREISKFGKVGLVNNCSEPDFSTLHSVTIESRADQHEDDFIVLVDDKEMPLAPEDQNSSDSSFTTLTKNSILSGQYDVDQLLRNPISDMVDRVMLDADENWLSGTAIEHLSDDMEEGDAMNDWQQIESSFQPRPVIPPFTFRVPQAPVQCRQLPGDDDVAVCRPAASTSEKNSKGSFGHLLEIDSKLFAAVSRDASEKKSVVNGGVVENQIFHSTDDQMEVGGEFFHRLLTKIAAHPTDFWLLPGTVEKSRDCLPQSCWLASSSSSSMAGETERESQSSQEQTRSLVGGFCRLVERVKHSSQGDWLSGDKSFKPFQFTQLKI